MFSRVLNRMLKKMKYGDKKAIYSGLTQTERPKTPWEF